MYNYKEVVNLCQRRVGQVLDKDNIETVYAEFNDRFPMRYIFVLHRNIIDSDTKSVEARYLRALTDKQYSPEVNVVHDYDYFKKTLTLFPIYTKANGFRY